MSKVKNSQTDISKLKDLQVKVEKWSKDRGISTNGKSTTQTLKLISEMGEIFEAFQEQDPTKATELFKDAIGDNIVVLINLSKLLQKEAKENNIELKTELDFENINKEANPEKYPLIEIGLVIVFSKLADAVGKQNFQEAMDLINESLSLIGDLTRIVKLFTIEDALESAYNEIKDRTGFLNENGNFIKSTDANYEKLYNEFLEKQKS